MIVIRIKTRASKLGGKFRNILWKEAGETRYRVVLEVQETVVKTGCGSANEVSNQKCFSKSSSLKRLSHQIGNLRKCGNVSKVQKCGRKRKHGDE